MMILVTYDVSQDEGGVRRLRKVAKICENVGQRVQKSVFECLVDPAQLVRFSAALKKVMNEEYDSLRIYYLGSNWKKRVEHFGVPLHYEQEETIIL